jgi:serine protease Do
MEDSPAEKAGLQAGDIITAFNDNAVNRSAELPPLVGRIRPDTEASLTLFRDGRKKELTVVIEELPDDTQQLASTRPATNRLGMRVKAPSPDQDAQGLEVVSVADDGPAADGGVRPGDIVIRLDNKPLNSVVEFEKMVQELPAGKPLPVLIQRGNGRLFLALTIPEE